MNNLKFKVGDKVRIRRDFKPTEFENIRYRACYIATVAHIDEWDFLQPYYVEFDQLTYINNEPYTSWLEEALLEPVVKPIMMCE